MAKSLFEKLKNVGVCKGETVTNSEYMDDVYYKTDMPILNIAWNASPDAGIAAGITGFAGKSRTFKSSLALVCVNSFLAQSDEHYCIFYDAEFGTKKSYFAQATVDTDRVMHCPVETLEQLKFDIVAKLKELKAQKSTDKYIFVVDSLGALSSEKETVDIDKQNNVQDMQRPKAIKALLRAINSKLKIAKFPLILINHTYETMDLYSKSVQGGGASVTYFPSDVFFLSRVQEKEGDKLIGYRFNIIIEKSRTIREGSKLSFVVTQKDGIIKHSGIFELALESEDIIQVSSGFYNLSDEATGQPIDDKKYRKKALNTKETIDIILARQSFRNYLKNNLLLLNGDSNIEDEYDEDLDEDLDDDFELEEPVVKQTKKSKK